jgi:hypothetical protein
VDEIGHVFKTDLRRRMKVNKKRKIIVAVAPVGKEI